MTEEKARERLGRITFMDIAMARGMICVMATRRGANMPKRGRDRMKRVSQVTKKWKEAKVS